MTNSPIPNNYGPTSFTTQALWQWDTSGTYPVATGYGVSGAYTPTKTGLTPQDLQNFVGIPLQYYQPTPTPVPYEVLQGWIRYAEDWVEQETSLLLAPTWVASPPCLQAGQTEATGVKPSSGSQIQMLGQDYDLADAAYDFFFPRAQDEGWMVQSLRYRPIRNVTSPARILSEQDFTAVKGFSYIYPLLSEFFSVPRTWFVEDQDFGLIRLVPAESIQMLPLFAMELAFMGFAESIPGALWLQYTAGLTSNDYNSRFRFIKELVLAKASIRALSAIQGTINMGVLQHQVLIDGVSYMSKFSETGPFGYQIKQYEAQVESLLESAISKVAGPSLITL